MKLDKSARPPFDSHYTQAQTTAELSWLASAPLIYSSNPSASLVSVNRPKTSYFGTPLKQLHRLGIHFEELYRIYLENTPEVTDIYDHIQINETGKTLGEADFLLSQNGELTHLEIAIKFYLKTTDTGSLFDYHGPSLSDTLGRKVSHLVDHQLELFNQPAAIVKLQSLGIALSPDTPINKLGLIYGWLFYHISELNSPHHQALSPNAQRGAWCETSEFESFISTLPQSCRFLVPHRSEWLIPASRQRAISYSTSEILAMLDDRMKPTQIWAVMGEGVSRQMLQRIFVVSADWRTKAMC
ncbi:DUF1853 family protein [Marinobacterium sp. LSUCC0821]|uniref:DUF1853 family protein n=1 Tax=Marinobacterium sp. LSUCC0821 TaxID=2668067 RepID=UPI001451EE61|nr:DUF1853 family protein [Marinobacterium sp. LSUCC0821]QJD70770.1 DUF1853 family protein [Marinobacterium sp. LSUCC0821]